MSKSVTVNFADGTSHVYDDVPDDVSNEEVQSRAQSDFNKEVEQVGAPTEQEKSTEAYKNTGMGEKVAAGIGAGIGLANQALQSPLGHLAEGAAGLGYLGNKINQLRTPPAAGPAVPMAPAQQAAQQAVNGGRPNLTVQPGGAGPVVPEGVPAMPAAQAAETGIISQARNIVQRLALDKVLKGAGIAAGAYQLGQGLFGTSPEEIAVMKQAEARKRAQGWKPLNER